MHPLTLDMGFTNRSSSEEVHCGGNGINISTLLNELGVTNVAFGISAGFTGDYLLKRLQEKGISCNFVRLEKGYTRINVKLQGIVMTICNGMGPKISQKKVDELLERIDAIGEGDTLILTGSIPNSLPANMYDIIMRRLEGRGIRFVVDAPGQLLMESLSARPFLIKPNNHEIGELFGVRLTKRDEVIPYAKKLQEKGAVNVLVSMAGEGAVLVDENGEVYQSEAPKGTVVNSVGAGDSMVAGFIYGYLKHGNYSEAFKYGLATGSASAFKEELAGLKDVEELYAKTWGDKK
jgi:1-phosphofructokinase